MLKDKKLKASATVEAAFIVPLTLFVTLAVVMLVFMLRNRIKMIGDIEFLLEYARECRQTTGKIDIEDLKECWNELSSDGYMYGKPSEPLIEIGGNEIKIKAEIEMDTPLGRLWEKMTGSSGVMKADGSIALTGREQIMRLIDAGKEIVNAD